MENFSLNESTLDTLGTQYAEKSFKLEILFSISKKIQNLDEKKFLRTLKQFLGDDEFSNLLEIEVH